MNADMWITAGAIALVMAVAAWGLALDRRAGRERDRLASADTAKRREWEAGRARATASGAAQAAREADPLCLSDGERAAFEAIAGAEEGWFAPGIAEAAQERIAREGETA